MTTISQHFKFSQYRKIDLLWMVCIAVLYGVIAKIVLSYYSVNAIATIVWPPSGLAMAALIINGKKYWPSVFFGALAANFWSGSSLDVSAAIAAGNTLEAVLGASLLNFMGNGHEPFNTLRNYTIFLLCGVFASPLASAAIGTVILGLRNLIPMTEFFPTLLKWWLGHGTGILIITPLILTWRQWPKEWLTRKLETIAILGTTFFVGQIVFIDWLHGYFGLINRGYWMYLFIAWIAVRLGNHGVTSAVVLIFCQASVGAIKRVGFFQTDYAVTGLKNLWFYTVKSRSWANT